MKINGVMCPVPFTVPVAVYLALKIFLREIYLYDDLKLREKECRNIAKNDETK